MNSDFRYFKKPDFTARRTLICLFVILFFSHLWSSSYILSQKLNPGANYSIYKYISEHKNESGLFPRKDDGHKHRYSPSYVDYTPFNSVVYRAIFRAPDNLDLAIFITYQAALMTAGILLLLHLSCSGVFTISHPVPTAIYFALNPLALRMLASDDKANLFFLPLLCITALISYPRLSGVFTGLFAGWSGLGVPALLVPFMAVHGKILIRFVVTTSGILLCIALFFAEGKESLYFFANRSAREVRDPFWFSIWRLFPDAIWLPLRQFSTIGLLGGIYLLLWLKRIKPWEAFICLCSTYLLFSNNTVPTRVLFFVPICALLVEDNKIRMSYLFCSGFLLTFFHFFEKHLKILNELTPVTYASIFAVNIPMAFPILLTLFRSMNIQRSAIPLHKPNFRND